VSPVADTERHLSFSGLKKVFELFEILKKEPFFTAISPSAGLMFRGRGMLGLVAI
jgi:hypothetical protein